MVGQYSTLLLRLHIRTLAALLSTLSRPYSLSLILWLTLTVPLRSLSLYGVVLSYILSESKVIESPSG